MHVIVRLCLPYDVNGCKFMCSVQQRNLFYASVLSKMYSEIIQVPTVVPTVHANYSMLLYMTVHAHCTQ